MLSRLFRTKDLDKILTENANQEHQLKKALSAFDLIIFGVGAMIGAIWRLVRPSPCLLF
jgi:APA family basic amino acid/polyamine antiporter